MTRHLPTLSTLPTVRPVLAVLVLLVAGLPGVVVASRGAGAAPATVAASQHASRASIVQNVVTATAPLSQAPTLTSTSGLTVVWLPSQVATGGRLAVVVHTVPRARVTLRLAFPDSTSVALHRRADAIGYARFQPSIAYQPQGSAEDATVTVLAVLRGAGLDDTVSGNVAVLQRITLAATLKAPTMAVVGRPLAVTVTSNEPGALVSFRLIYPDKAVESLRGGYTNTAGIYTRSFAVSRSDGTSGYLIVQAIVRYNGVQVSRSGRVALRAPKL